MFFVLMGPFDDDDDDDDGGGGGGDDDDDDDDDESRPWVHLGRARPSTPG